ncbi:MAG: amidohydrolase family protein [Pseudomonadota bacterium]
MQQLDNCIVLAGETLAPHHCHRFGVDGDTLGTMDLGPPVMELDQGALVIIPALYNGHTHMGDSCLPDGATGLTLEQGFFRPDGYKYRALAAMPWDVQLAQVTAQLRYMARTGTVCHLDFREQGAAGSALLREAAAAVGIDSIILGQFDGVPFDKETLSNNSEPLPPTFVTELNAILDVADGFSESTMNDLTDPAWCEIREITEQRNKRRAIHCLENTGYRDDSIRITGRGDLERAIGLLAPDIIVHMTVANADEIATLKASGVTAVLNPRANANLGLPLPPIAGLMQAGVNLLLGTDNGLLNSPNLFAELDFTYKLAKSQFGNSIAPDPLDILQFATANIATVLGGDHYGFLAPGLPASFVVLDFTQPHLAQTRHLPASILTRVTPEDVLGTYRQGRALYESPRLQAAWSKTRATGLT